jgi:hypothetical protein
MSFSVIAPDNDIELSVDLVPLSLIRRRKNIAFLRIRAIAESRGGGFMVEGFVSESPLGSAVRRMRIGPHGRNQSIWVLVANAAYALSLHGS